MSSPAGVSADQASASLSSDSSRTARVREDRLARLMQAMADAGWVVVLPPGRRTDGWAGDAGLLRDGPP